MNTREERHAEALRKSGEPIRNYWFGDNTLLTIFFNASSVGIPEAERYVIKTVTMLRNHRHLPGFEERIAKIIHEETGHSRVHDAYNVYLSTTGLDLRFHLRAAKKINAFLSIFSLRTRLAICATIEHFTASMARQILDTGILEGKRVDERMDRVWTWHALEELDHRSIAFDLYYAAGGTYPHRLFGTLICSFIFLYMQNVCFLSFMHQRGVLFDAYVWKKGLPFLFGRRGIYRSFFLDWARYFSPTFHPSKVPIRNRLQKQLHHYHIENELIHYFPTATP